ncbi:MAG: AgmX/PglI C-terminal domain-containing protein, partial [Myxococcales bacterium]|nr:AgmX/PglI C-terminal domain-containing protein [Myxococcales bacterium]
AEPSALAQAASQALLDEHAAHHDGDGVPAAVLIPPAPPRRSHTGIYVAAAVVLFAVVALVVVFAVTGDAEDEGGHVGGTSGNFEDLGRTIDDPRYVTRGSGGSAEAPPDPRGSARTGTGTVKRGTGSTSTSGGTGTTPGTGAGTGKTEVVIGPDGRPLEPLSPDDVIAVAARMSTGTQRCYNRALKEDPFLKVKSIKALISVGKDGVVSSVSLDSMQTQTLGQCLTAAIKRWTFRKSTAGIDTQITLKFEQGGM